MSDSEKAREFVCRWKACQPKNGTRKELERHFQEIGFVDRKDQPKDRVVAGLGLHDPESG